MDAPGSGGDATFPHSPRARQHQAWLGLGLLLLVGCQTGRPEADRGASRALEQRLAQLLIPLQRAGATVSLLVLEGSTGAVLASQRATDLVLPASTQKLLTTAAVLRYLPADYRFTTVVAGPAPADGVVDGDLWLVGDGDPGLGSARGLPGAPAQAGLSNTLTEWVNALKRAGVKRVTGSVVGDGRVLPPPALGTGWSWDDGAYAYSVPPAGLTFNESSVELQLSEVGTALQPPVVLPATGLVNVKVERVLGDRLGLGLLPGPLAGEVLAHWQAPPRAPPVKEWVAVPDTAGFAAEQLTLALRAAGIDVVGPPRAARTAETPLVAPQFFAATPSMTLRELCALTNRDSLNLHAEVLLMQLGRLAGTEPTTRGGLALVEEMLREAGQEPAKVRVVDGSGLSRMNLLSAEVLVAVLRLALARDPTFVDLLPAAGAEGSLRKRLVGTVGQGRVHAKSGSMTGHRNLVGVVDTLGGRKLHFALMIGGIVLPRTAVDAVVDAVLLALVNG